MSKGAKAIIIIAVVILGSLAITLGVASLSNGTLTIDFSKVPILNWFF